MTAVRCRARVSEHCYNGREERTIQPDYRMADDGTWNGSSVVCDACYVKLLPYTPSGMGHLEELPRAIAEARDVLLPLDQRVQRFVNEATAAGYTATTEERDGGYECRATTEDGETVMHLFLAEGQRARPLY